MTREELINKIKQELNIPAGSEKQVLEALVSDLINNLDRGDTFTHKNIGSFKVEYSKDDSGAYIPEKVVYSASENFDEPSSEVELDVPVFTSSSFEPVDSLLSPGAGKPVASDKTKELIPEYLDSLSKSPVEEIRDTVSGFISEGEMSHDESFIDDTVSPYTQKPQESLPWQFSSDWDRKEEKPFADEEETAEKEEPDLEVEYEDKGSDEEEIELPEDEEGFSEVVSHSRKIEDELSELEQMQKERESSRQKPVEKAPEADTSKKEEPEKETGEPEIEEIEDTSQSEIDQMMKDIEEKEESEDKETDEPAVEEDKADEELSVDDFFHESGEEERKDEAPIEETSEEEPAAEEDGGDLDDLWEQAEEEGETFKPEEAESEESAGEEEMDTSELEDLWTKSAEESKSEEGEEESEASIEDLLVDDVSEEEEKEKEEEPVEEPEEETEEEAPIKYTSETDEKEEEPELDESLLDEKIKTPVIWYVAAFLLITLTGLLSYWKLYGAPQWLRETGPRPYENTDVVFTAQIIGREYKVPVSFPYGRKDKITEIDPFPASEELPDYEDLPVIEPDKNAVEEGTIEDGDGTTESDVKKFTDETAVTTSRTEGKMGNSTGDINVKSNIFYNGSTYSIQMSSWKSVTKAQKEADKYIRKGYDAFVAKADLEGMGRWYRVRIGNFPSLQEAENFLNKMK